LHDGRVVFGDRTIGEALLDASRGELVYPTISSRVPAARARTRVRVTNGLLDTGRCGSARFRVDAAGTPTTTAKTEPSRESAIRVA